MHTMQCDMTEQFVLTNKSMDAQLFILSLTLETYTVNSGRHLQALVIPTGLVR